MSNSESLTSESVGTGYPVLNWIAQHAQQSPAILGDIEQMISAASVEDKWKAFKALGDLVVGDIASFPLDPAPASDADLAALSAMPVLKANGAIISLLLQNLPQVMAAIQAIVALFKTNP